MAGTEFDVIVGGVKAKTLKGDDGRPGYRRRFVRREIQQQLITQASTPVMSSREDSGKFYQTSWVKGATWWKPILGPNDADSYYRATHFNLWDEPGKVVPDNQIVETEDSTDVVGQQPWMMDDNGDVYVVGQTAVVNASYNDVFKWTPGSNAFVQESGYHSGVPVSGPDVRCAVFEPSANDFLLIDSVGDMHRFDPVAPTSTNDYIAGVCGGNIYNGTSIFIQPNQGVMIYNGDTLWTRSLSTVTEVYDDGLGPDAWEGALSPGAYIADPTKRNFAISTPEGIYYVKNTVNASNGLPVAYVFRVDKQANGTWVGEPIATLPIGDVALDITHHLGQVLISASPADAYNLLTNNTSQHIKIVIYAIDSQSGLSVIGSPLGGRTEVDESPHQFLMASGSLLYIGGHKRLWVYDAANGGLHAAFEWATELTSGPVVNMVATADSASDGIFLFGGRQVSSGDLFYTRLKNGLTNDPDTVVAFGDDETHYTLESNYFDFGLPMELKTLRKVEILREAGDGDQEWTVQISVDGGAYADVLTHSTSGETYGSSAITGITGRRFQYKLIYQTKDTNRNALEGLMITADTGEMVQEWELVLDGSELLNVDNEVQDEQAFYDAMVALAATAGTTTIVDNMQEQAQETDTATTTNAKILGVEILKSKPGESLVQVTLREV